MRIALKLMGVVLLALAVAPGWGQPASDAALRAALSLTPDPVKGKAAFGDCAACHRKDASGRPLGPVPRLTGQHMSVIVKQLLDIRSGLRINPPMKLVLEDPPLDLQTLVDVAAYVQSLPITGNFSPGPGTGKERGKALFEQGCVGCHGSRAEGQAEHFRPALAGQHYAYLLRELELIRDGGRGNSDAAMAALLKPMGGAELQALADYLSSMPPARQ